MEAQADFDTQVSRVAALGEPVRRALYSYVVMQADAVSRGEAARGAGVARHVAKFHLDKLVDDGLLEVEFRRSPGRRGPGAGRPAKLYRRSSDEVAVTLPERHYELAGRLLAKAVTDSERDGVPVREALSAAARRTGAALGRRVLERAGPDSCPTALLEATAAVLRECGYEPRAVAGGLVLANCPFHSLAREYTDLVCGMNLDLVRGLVDDVPLAARLDPVPGQCCVQLRGLDERDDGFR